MKPVEFKEFNTKLGVTAEQAEKGVKSCPAFLAERAPLCITCWQVTWRDLWRMLLTRRVWLTHMSHSMPPAALSTEHPFKPE